MPMELSAVMAGFVVVAILLALTLFLRERAQRRTLPMPAGLQAEINLPFGAQWTLYHNPFSLCSKKIRVCLAEYGVVYDSVAIDLIETGSYQNISREFLKVNPAATVPVLLHNAHPIYESHEQLKYVASVVDQTGLLVPQDPQLRQVMDAWVHKTSLLGDDPIGSPETTAGNAVPGLTVPIFASMLAKVPTAKIVEGLLFHRIKKRALFFLLMKRRGLQKTLMLKPVTGFLKRSAKAMAAHLHELELQLENSGGPWICGDQFTLADVGMMVIFDRLREGDWLYTLVHHRPMLDAYWTSLQQRPSYQAGCADFTHPAVAEATAELAALKQADQWPSGIPR
jgi:glutathione S-transferase